MEEQFGEISKKQKASWNKFSPGWKKWSQELNNHMQPASDAIIHLLQPAGKENILDIASGTGEPGCSIAKLLPGGRVTITDLADEMVQIARENASEAGITNVDFLACDVCELPFADNSFDAVSCRMGFMFFPDMLLAAGEILRVLKPGGRFATSVWSPAEKNSWVTYIGDTIKRIMQLPDPTPGAPGIFRCGQAGLMTTIFKQAGFKNISETEVDCSLKCGMAENYWEMMTEIAAPVVAALSNADDKTKDTIKREVFEIVNTKYPGGNIIMNGSCMLIYGEK